MDKSDRDLMIRISQESRLRQPASWELIGRCDRLADAFREAHSSTSNVERDELWGHVEVSGSSNADAILRHLDTLREIRMQAEALKYEADPSEALEKLEERLPSRSDVLTLESKYQPPVKVA